MKTFTTSIVADRLSTGASGAASPTEFKSQEDTVLTSASVSLPSHPADSPLTVAAGDALLDALQALGSGADDLPCRVEDADLWFAETPAELDRAKALCEFCPVRQLCLDAALARREPWGVWGGAIFEHGAVIARKRPRGRPRKDRRDVAA